MSTSVFQCHWSRLEFFDVANLGNHAPRLWIQKEYEGRRGGKTELLFEIRKKKKKEKRKIFSTVKVHYFYIVGNNVFRSWLWLWDLILLADKFQKNVHIVFMRVILSCCVIVDIWLKQSFYTISYDEHIVRSLLDW